MPDFSDYSGVFIIVDYKSSESRNLVLSENENRNFANFQICQARV